MVQFISQLDYKKNTVDEGDRRSKNTIRGTLMYISAPLLTRPNDILVSSSLVGGSINCVFRIALRSFVKVTAYQCTVQYTDFAPCISLHCTLVYTRRLLQREMLEL